MLGKVHTAASSNIGSVQEYVAPTAESTCSSLIQSQDIEVTRRYSEFSSLRTALVNLHPTLVVPPIPEKHTMADYAAKPTKAKEDAGIIDQRKRMLAVFLNRCRRMSDVLEDGVYWRFLDPNSSWVRSSNVEGRDAEANEDARMRSSMHIPSHQCQRTISKRHP
jgi:PX domain